MDKQDMIMLLAQVKQKMNSLELENVEINRQYQELLLQNNELQKKYDKKKQIYMAIDILIIITIITFMILQIYIIFF